MAATTGAGPALAPPNGTVKAANGADAASSELKPVDADAVISKLKLSDDDLLGAYRQMLNIRHFEEQCNKAFRSGKVGGYLHLYIGQEAVSTGIINCLKEGDQVTSTYRDHAHVLALGGDPGRTMAEIYGRASGISNGKGGSMHLCDAEHGFTGGDGIVGGNVPLATGFGWALKYKKTDNICVCYFGDGSMNAGAFHEALNMAALYRLPILYVLENNGYAMGTSIARSHANTDLGSRADSYAIPHAKVDGQDYFAVRELASEVIERMRKDPYPFFIDAITYRYVGHGAADGSETQKTYREESEVEKWRKRDPLFVLAKVLTDRKLLTEEKKRQMDKEAIDDAKAAADFADKSEFNAPEDLYKDVYAA